MTQTKIISVLYLGPSVIDAYLVIDYWSLEFNIKCNKAIHRQLKLLN